MNLLNKFIKKNKLYCIIVLFIFTFGICVLYNIFFRRIPHYENMHNNRRIVVTMTTIPERITKKTILKTLDSLFEQTILPDIIYINVPIKTLNNEEYPLDMLKNMTKKYENIVINVVEKDLGPITKIIPTLSFIEPSDYVFLVDDDVKYKPYMIEQLINTNENAVGYAGRSRMDFKDSSFFSGPVDFLETFAGVMYRGELLIGLDEYANNLGTTCQKQDDIVIGKFLHTKQITPIVGKSLQQSGDHDAESTTELRTKNLEGENKNCYEKMFT